MVAWAGGLLVKSMAYLARFFHLSEYTTAFLLMSLATSIPELFIGLSSAFQGVPHLSFGNLLGANLVNLTLLIGLTATAAGTISTNYGFSKGNFLLVGLAAFLPIVMALDGVISRSDGLILILSFMLYLARLLDERDHLMQRLNHIPLDSNYLARIFRHFGLFIFGVVVLLASSALVIWSGKQIAFSFGLPLVSFGLVLLALGTTLPEVMFTIKASRMHHPDLSLGNALGSVAFNSTFIVGLVALMTPIYLPSGDYLVPVSVVLFLALLLLNFFVYTKAQFSRLEGVAMILLYVIFLIAQIMF